MTLGIITIIPKSAMLMQNDLWDDIQTFLHLLLDPLFAALQDEGLRGTILTSIIWSFIIICGLIFVVYEFPSIIKLVGQSPAEPIRRLQKTKSTPRSQTAITSARRHQLSRDKAQKERERRADAVKETGVSVAAKLEGAQELLRLTVSINNGGTSKIDMVIVDLDLPSGINVDVGSFRMQRLGSINSGEMKTAEFLLRPLGGDPLEIGGHVEFLGASYEVSIIAIPVPDMEGEIDNE